MVKIDTLLQAGCPKIRLQLTHKIETSELDEIPIVMREPLRRQPSVNRFADVDESLGLFTHVENPYKRKDKE
jgi:hypothetical protein